MFIPMDKTCNPEQLYERKFPKNELPLKKCAECLFNVLCLDYSTYEEDKLPEMLKNNREKGE
jgi:hypothetical protein